MPDRQPTTRRQHHPLIVAAALLLTAGAPVAHAGGQGESGPAVEVPEDPRESYAVGFQVFEGAELSEQNRLLARTIPRLLAEQLSVLPEHELSQAERKAQARALIAEAVREAGEALDDAVEARAGLRFDTGREDERRRKIEEAQAEVAAARAELEAARGIDPGDIEIAAMKPITLGDGETEPLEADRLTARAAREEDLDLLVTGHIEELDGTIIVTARAYNRFLGRMVFERRVAGERGDTDGLVGPLRDGLAEVLLGRPWGRLSVQTDRADAAIYVDDRLAGFGEATLAYTRTGAREVRVAVEGVDERRRTVEVTPSQTTRVALPLQVAAGEQVRIESSPPGADVYLGSVWQGITPLTLERPGAPRTVILSAEGFLDETVVLSPQVPDLISRELVRDPGNWPELVQERRDRFYRAFGWFALSVPIPVMLNGMYQDIAALYPGGQPSPELSDAEAERLARTANTMLWSARGATAVSAGLFVNMMVHLIQYIRAGQYAHD
jgi:hypothetical protein